MNAYVLKMTMAVFGVAAVCINSDVRAEGEKAPPPALQIQVPRAEKPPVIDGVMAPGEWDNAVSWPAGGWQFVDVRHVEFFVMWDAENVYVAQRTTLLPGERLIRLGREPKPDVAVSWESEMEVYG